MDSLAAIQDWEDRVFGVTGHWTAVDATSASRCETACPFAKAASGAPELCSDVIHRLETETFRTLNPRYELLPLESLLSKGQASCRFEHRLRR
jgi:predicted ArsR family transcriptional regulator